MNWFRRLLARNHCRAAWRRGLKIRTIVRQLVDLERRRLTEAAAAAERGSWIDVYIVTGAYMDRTCDLGYRLRKLTERPIRRHRFEKALGHPQWLVVVGDEPDGVRWGRHYDLPDDTRRELLLDSLVRLHERYVKRLDQLRHNLRQVHLKSAEDSHAPQ